MIKSLAAIAYDIGGALQIEPVTVGSPGPGQVLIENRAAGLCHSDLYVLEGHSPRHFPIILGHEGAGVVLSCGDGVTSLKAGDHVVTCAVGECGRCTNCASRKTNLCENSDIIGALATGFGPSSAISRRGGPVTVLAQGATFANHAVVDEIQVTKIPDSIPFDVAALFGCAVITGVGAALFTAKVEQGSSVIVFGLGGVGLNVIDGARLAGASTIIGVDTNPAKEAIARRFGLTDFVNAKEAGDGLLAALTGLTGGGADYAFECVGNPRLGEIAIQSTRMEWGKTVMIGAAPAADPLHLPSQLLLMGRTVTGSIFGNAKTRTDMARIAEWFAEGKLSTDLLISHRLPFAAINDGFALMRRGESIRAVVHYQGGNV